MSGWIAAIAGFVVFGLAAKGLVVETEDSTVDTPWWVPQSAEDYANKMASDIQQEQKSRVETALTQAIGKGAAAMTVSGVLIGAWWAGGQAPRKG